MHFAAYAISDVILVNDCSFCPSHFPQVKIYLLFFEDLVSNFVGDKV